MYLPNCWLEVKTPVQNISSIEKIYIIYPISLQTLDRNPNISGHHLRSLDSCVTFFSFLWLYFLLLQLLLFSAPLLYISHILAYFNSVLLNDSSCTYVSFLGDTEWYSALILSIFVLQRQNVSNSSWSKISEEIDMIIEKETQRMCTRACPDYANVLSTTTPLHHILGCA